MSHQRSIGTLRYAAQRQEIESSNVETKFTPQLNIIHISIVRPDTSSDLHM